MKVSTHYSLRLSLSITLMGGFYQESGRAGRDGKPAKSIVYYSREDQSLMDFLLKKDEARVHSKQNGKASSRPNAALRSHNAFKKYCEGSSCRRHVSFEPKS